MKHWVFAAIVFAWASIAAGQTAPPPGGGQATGQADPATLGQVPQQALPPQVDPNSQGSIPGLPEGQQSGEVPEVDDPYKAYSLGYYDQALQHFVDQQVERPRDSDLALNIGASHYQMRDYDAARLSFEQAALSPNTDLRQQAVYNLGNTAFRQGKLDEAIKFYQSALELNPDDQDAKYNIEYVRNEIRRRHEEAKKRQDQQQQQQQQQQGQGQQQGNQEEFQDSDGDGLPDEVEKGADNPTDPSNPDSDGDSVPDGAEDANGNGKVDAGETDPNNADTDGDGQSDAVEHQKDEEPQQEQGEQTQGQPGDEEPPEEQQEGQQQQQQQAQAQPGEEREGQNSDQEAQTQQSTPDGGMTEEQADRYLRGLDDRRPDRRRRGKPPKGYRTGKDW